MRESVVEDEGGKENKGSHPLWAANQLQEDYLRAREFEVSEAKKRDGPIRPRGSEKNA